MDIAESASGAQNFDTTTIPDEIWVKIISFASRDSMDELGEVLANKHPDKPSKDQALRGVRLNRAMANFRLTCKNFREVSCEATWIYSVVGIAKVSFFPFFLLILGFLD